MRIGDKIPPEQLRQIRNYNFGSGKRTPYIDAVEQLPEGAEFPPMWLRYHLDAKNEIIEIDYCHVGRRSHVGENPAFFEQRWKDRLFARQQKKAAEDFGISGMTPRDRNGDPVMMIDGIPQL